MVFNNSIVQLVTRARSTSTQCTKSCLPSWTNAARCDCSSEIGLHGGGPISLAHTLVVCGILIAARIARPMVPAMSSSSAGAGCVAYSWMCRYRGASRHTGQPLARCNSQRTAACRLCRQERRPRFPNEASIATSGPTMRGRVDGCGKQPHQQPWDQQFVQSLKVQGGSFRRVPSVLFVTRLESPEHVPQPIL